MNLWLVTQLFLIEWLQWLSEPGSTSPGHGPLNNVWLALALQGSPNVGPLTTWANLTEASYHGYARLQVVWYPVYTSTDGTVTLESASLFFQPSDSALSQTVSQFILTDAPTGGNVLAGAPLALPGVTLSSPLTILKALVNMKLGFSPVYGGVVKES